ncbi:hypothetical protein KR018_001406 [Drosophila ironensis]|nr:hypothetical protein KR018_001406 [Drosophila ironensis]
MLEAVRDNLVRLQAVVALIGLVALTPILILAAVVRKLFHTICCWQSPKSIVGEVAVVTGGGHGLGRALCLELARNGCHVAVADINLSGAEETVKHIRKTYGVSAKAYKTNVTSHGELAELNSQVISDLGPVTVLVNNAGILTHSNNLNPAPAEVQQMIDVNLTSHFWTKAVFLPRMKELRRGFILTIGSELGFFQLPYASAYTASKWGVTGHMRALRMELALEKQKNIHVTSVFPVFLRTNDVVTDVARHTNVESLYPLYSGKEVAERVVAGMLRGDQEIHFPNLMSPLYRLIHLLPCDWQNRLLIIVAGHMMRSCFELFSQDKVN